MLSKTTSLLLLLALTAAASAGKYNRTMDLGKPAPVWSKLPGVDGKEHSLADLAKKEIVVVAFTCTSCPYAIDYEDRMIAFAKKHCGKDSKVAMVAINVNKKREEDRLPAMKKRATEKKFPFAYLFDESQKIAVDFGATRTPEFFVLDKKRNVVYMGAMDDSTDAKKVKKNHLEAAVMATIAGEKIEVGETVAIGCNITFERRRRSRKKATAK